MGFGFDPSIILAPRRAPSGPSLNETLQTLAQLATQRGQQQQQQATLADLIRQQQQRQEMEGVYRQYADNPDGLATGLMHGGFGPQAFAAQDQAAQMQLQRAQQEKLHGEVMAAQRKHVGELYYGVKDQDAFNAALADTPEPYRSQILQGTKGVYNPDHVQRLASLAIPAEKRAEMDAEAQQKGLDRASAEKRTRITASAGGGGSTELTPEAVESVARLYIQTGTLPALGMGKTGTANRNAVLNRVAQLDPTANIGSNKSSFHADSASLQDAQKLADSMDRNEAKARGDIEVLRSKMKDVFDSGSPFINAPGRALAAQAGDPKVAAFNTARTAAINQINKVLSATAGTGTLSDSSRKEAEELVRKDASLAQLNAVFDVLTQDMARNKAAMHDSVAAIKGRMGGSKATSGAPHPQDSAAVTWAKAHKDDPRAQKILELNGGQ